MAGCRLPAAFFTILTTVRISDNPFLVIMALTTFVFAGSFLSTLVAAQTPDSTAENRPKLTTYKCTTEGGCIAQNTALVLDASSHRIYQPNAPDSNCGDWGSAANATACPDEETCQQNCILQGIPGKQLPDTISALQEQICPTFGRHDKGFSRTACSQKSYSHPGACPSPHHHKAACLVL